MISIVVPVYNSALYLNQCVESLINQSYIHIEIILINDGSTDDSGAICDQLALKDRRIRIFHIENNGVSNARNIGIEKAVFEYIMFVDSDDWVDSKTCEEAYFKIKNEKSDILFWSYSKEYKLFSQKENYLENNNNLFIGKNSNVIKTRCIGLIGNQMRHPTKTDVVNTPWAKLYSRNLILKNNIRFVERAKVGMEDVLFNIEVMMKAQRISYLNRYLNHYRIDNPYSLTKIDTKNLYHKFINLFDAIDEILVRNDLIDASLAMNNRVACSTINIVLSMTHPSNRVGFKSEVSMIREMLNSERFKESFSFFSLKYLPLHWKLFFYLCKNRLSVPLYFLALIIRKIR